MVGFIYHDVVESILGEFLIMILHGLNVSYKLNFPAFTM